MNQNIQVIKAHFALNVKNVETWVHDPDGNEWEVFVVLADNLPEKVQPSESVCCAPAPISIGVKRENSVCC